MNARIERFVFGEPAGRLSALVMFSGSALFLGIYVYYDVLHGIPSVSALFLSGAFGLSGIAESLPKERRHAAGGLRILAILVLVVLVAFTLFAPELVLA